MISVDGEVITSGAQRQAATVAETELVAFMQNLKDQPKTKESDSIRRNAPPGVARSRAYKLYLKKKVAAAPGDPEVAFAWMTEIEHAKKIEDLQDSKGKASLDANLGGALCDVVTGELARNRHMTNVYPTRVRC